MKKILDSSSSELKSNPETKTSIEFKSTEVKFTQQLLNKVFEEHKNNRNIKKFIVEGYNFTGSFPLNFIATYIGSHPSIASLFFDCSINLSKKELYDIFFELSKNNLLTLISINQIEFKKDLPKESELELLKFNSHLTELNLENNQLGDGNIAWLCESLKNNKQLTVLNLSQTDMGDSGAKALSLLLDEKSALPLAYLDISLNRIATLGISEIGSKLEHNRFLHTIIVDNNQINYDGMLVLANSLIANRSLTTLSVCGNMLDKPIDQCSSSELKNYSENIDKFVRILFPPPASSSKKRDIKKAQYNTPITKLFVFPEKVTFPETEYEEPIDRSEKMKALWRGMEKTDSQVKSKIKKQKEGFKKKKLELKKQKKSDEKELKKKNSLVDKINSSVKIFLQENESKSKSLVTAVLSGKWNKIPSLLKTVSVHTFSEDGDSLLHLAVKKDSVEIVKILLEAKANAYLLDAEEKTALTIARARENSKIIELLSENKSSGKKVKRKREAEKEESSTKIKQKEASKLENIIPPLCLPSSSSSSSSSSTSSTLSTALLETTEAHFLDIIANGQKFQLAHILTTDQRSTEKYGIKGLQLAVKTNQKDCAASLLERKVDVNAPDERGYPPLYAIASQIESDQDEDPTIKNQLLIALMLIRHGAKAHIAVKDLDFKTSGFTVLHKAVARGNYRLMKIILSAGTCNPNQADGNKETALDWAVKQGNLAILARLLIDHRLSKESIEICLRETKPSDEAKKLLESRLKKSFPGIDPGIQWTRHLSVLFGNRYGKVKKSLVIDSQAEHATLCLQNNFTKQRLFKPKDAQAEEKDHEGNPVTASLIFIVSTYKYKKGDNEMRSQIRVPLNFTGEYHLSLSSQEGEHRKQEVRYRASSAPIAFFNHPQRQTYRPLKNIEIDEKYKAFQENKDPSFHRLFHHGEQALLSHLEQDNVVAQLVQTLSKSPAFIQGCKVYGVILNIHSPRYSCENCEAAILGEQNPEKSNFLRLLAAQLKLIGCILPTYSPLRMLTQVSSYISFHGQPIETESHLPLQVDFRACNNQLILAQDLSAQKSQLTQYQSSVKMV